MKKVDLALDKRRSIAWVSRHGEVASPVEMRQKQRRFRYWPESRVLGKAHVEELPERPVATWPESWM